MVWEFISKKFSIYHKNKWFFSFLNLGARRVLRKIYDVYNVIYHYIDNLKFPPINLL